MIEVENCSVLTALLLLSGAAESWRYFSLDEA